MGPRDTSDDALRVQIELLQRTSGTRQIGTAIELTALAGELALAGIRARHPGATAEQIEDEYCRLVFGSELATRVRVERRRRRDASQGRA